jgi:copper transport protein
MTALGKDGQIWYIDPTRNILGNYDPLSKDNQQFTIPLQVITSTMAMAESQDIWLVVGRQPNNTARFSPASNEFTIYDIPTPNSLPTDIAVDREGKVWFTESIGKIGRLDPAKGAITEYQPSGDVLEEPTSILPDPRSSQVFVSEHEGQQISVLDLILDTFSEYSIISEEGLPFGMALDDYGNLWFAQHVIDRIGLIDPENNQITEVQVPTNGSFVQCLVPDDQGRIWFAEQRGSSLGAIRISLKPNSASINSNNAIQERDLNEGIQSGKEEQASIDSRMGSGLSISGRLGFGFADILGPLIAGGLFLPHFYIQRT